MKNILIKSVLAVTAICSAVSYSAFNPILTSGATGAKLSNAKQSAGNASNKVSNSSNKNAIFVKYNKADKDLQDVAKEKKKKAKQKDNDGKTIVDLDAFKFKISGYATFCGAVAGIKNTYYDGTNIPKELNIQQEENEANGENKKNIVKFDNKTTKDKDGLDLVAGEAGIKFKADGELENNTRYGALLEIQAEKDDIDIDKAFGYFGGDQFGLL